MKIVKPRCHSWLLLTLIVLLRTPSAPALDPHTSLSQAQHTVWSLQEGAPSRVVDLAQTEDGFLWLASQMGLYRFDGQRFQQVLLPGTDLSQPDITALTAAENDELWVGTRRNGIFHLQGAAILQHFGTESGLPRATVFSLRKDGSGNLWSAGAAGVFQLRQNRLERVWPAPDSPAAPAANLLRDAAGKLCFTTDGAVWCKSAAESTFHLAFSGAVEDLAVDAPGNFQVWVSGKGLLPLSSNGLPEKSTAWLHTAIPHGHCVFTRSGELYFLTYGHGLTRISQLGAEKTVETFSSSEGLQSPFLSALFEDREGNVWVGTTKGLERFRNGRFVPMPLFAGDPSTVMLPSADGGMWVGRRNDRLLRVAANNQIVSDDQRLPTGVTAAFRDADGSAWFGASPLLWHVSGTSVTKLPLPAFVQGSSDVQAIGRDAQDALWVSVVRFGTLMYKDGTWSRVQGAASAGDYANSFRLDSQSNFWVAYHGHVQLRSLSGVRTLAAADGLDFGDVLSFADRDGLLVAGAERGLGVFADGRFRQVHTDADSLLRGISGLVFTSDGALWAHASTALLRVAPEDVPRLRTGGMARLHMQVFSFADGLPGLAPAVRPLPSMVLAQDGRLWLSTTSGVTWLDALHYPRNAVAPVVRILDLRAGGHTLPDTTARIVPPHTRGISVDFTAPSLSTSTGVHYRTRLAGFDNDWQDVGSSHSVTYATLPPGHYRFEVQAGNEDDLWNRVGDATEFTVEPAFYQTTWFRVLCALGALAVLWLIYRIRLHTVAARVRDLMAERLSERERIAAELHDTLLQSVQGLILLFSGVAAQLPPNGRVNDSVEAAIQRAELLLEEGRDSVRDLRRKSFDLGECFKALRVEFESSETEYNFTQVNRQPELQQTVCEEVFKLGREAIRNAAQHAKASRVNVSLAFLPDALQLLVQDDGVGMSADTVRRGRAGHWGLLGMAERANTLRGRLEVESARGKGTNVRLRLPAFTAYSNGAPSMSTLLRSYWRRFWQRIGPFNPAKGIDL